MKKYLAMFLAAVCLFACFGVTAFADDPIVIGILQDTTGGTATLGKSVQKGVEDAIADKSAVKKFSSLNMTRLPTLTRQ